MPSLSLPLSRLPLLRTSPVVRRSMLPSIRLSTRRLVSPISCLAENKPLDPSPISKDLSPVASIEWQEGIDGKGEQLRKQFIFCIGKEIEKLICYVVKEIENLICHVVKETENLICHVVKETGTLICYVVKEMLAVLVLYAKEMLAVLVMYAKEMLAVLVLYAKEILAFLVLLGNDIKGVLILLSRVAMVLVVVFLLVMLGFYVWVCWTTGKLP